MVQANGLIVLCNHELANGSSGDMVDAMTFGTERDYMPFATHLTSRPRASC